jgi:YD repeat-containing protein
LDRSPRKRDGVTLTYAYDGMNRLTQKTVPASASAPGYSVFYNYDVNGLQLSARFGSATGVGITNAYDGFGRLPSTTTNMDGTARTLPFLYDAHGNRTQVETASTGYSGYTYDAADRMTSVLVGIYPAVTFGYDAAGRRQAMTSLTGAPVASVAYGYDPVGRLQSLAHDLAGPASDQSYDFTYNPASQIATRTQSNVHARNGGRRPQPASSAFSLSTRSVRSQGNRSPSALRPKWP